MSEFEVEEILETARSKVAGLFLNLHPNPSSEPAIMATVEEVKLLMDQFVEAKVAQLAGGIVEQVETKVKGVLKDALADRASAPVESDATTWNEVRDRIENIRGLDDTVLLNEFAARVVLGAYTAEQLRRLSWALQASYEEPELFRSESE